MISQGFTLSTTWKTVTLAYEDLRGKNVITLYAAKQLTCYTVDPSGPWLLLPSLYVHSESKLYTGSTFLRADTCYASHNLIRFT